MKRTAEFVLSLIGGILGILSSIFLMTVGAFASLFSQEAGAATTTLAVIPLIISIIAIVGGVIIKKKAKLGKILLLATAVLLIIFSFLPFFGFTFIIPAILVLIGAILGLVRKEQTSAAA